MHVSRNLSRSATFSLLPLALVTLLAFVSVAPGYAQGVDTDPETVDEAAEAMTQTPDTQSTLTPAEALRILEEGNERFTNGNMLERDLMEQVAQTAGGQYPFSVVLDCIDSRVPAEIVFDQGIGDMFTARVAGNFVNTDILGSMEFATAVAGAKLVVVLGHTECGAVKGACDHVELGNLTHTLSNIAPAVYAVQNDMEGPYTSANKEFVHAVTVENVERTVEDVLERSPIMADLVAEGELMVVGAMYDVATGDVEFFDAVDETGVADDM